MVVSKHPVLYAASNGIKAPPSFLAVLMHRSKNPSSSVHPLITAAFPLVQLLVNPSDDLRSPQRLRFVYRRWIVRAFSLMKAQSGATDIALSLKLGMSMRDGWHSV
jgi:hypothetical protein